MLNLSGRTTRKETKREIRDHSTIILEQAVDQQRISEPIS